MLEQKVSHGAEDHVPTENTSAFLEPLVGALVRSCRHSVGTNGSFVLVVLSLMRVFSFNVRANHN